MFPKKKNKNTKQTKTNTNDQRAQTHKLNQKPKTSDKSIHTLLANQS